MKKLLGGLFARGLAAGLAIFACVSVAKAHPYASLITNSVSGGTNFVSFYLNEGGGAVTVTTYPSATVLSLGTLGTGGTSFALPTGDTNYSISVSKTGTGAPNQISTDVGFMIWNGGMTLRAVGVNSCAQYGDAFGRVYIGATGQATASGGTGGPAYRAWGVYAVTPDMINNAIYGGRSPLAAVPVTQSNTLTFTSAPVNGNTFVMDGVTYTWTNNVTIPATQVAVTNSAAASATNLAAVLNATLANHPGTTSVTVSGSVVSMLQFAQATTGAAYFTYANAANLGPFGNDFTTGNSGFGSGPYRIIVNPQDGSVFVTDTTIGNAQIYVFGRNLEYTNQIWTVTGLTQGESVLEHGYPADIAMRGSLAKSNLQIWTAELDMPIPSYFNDQIHYTMGNGGLGNLGSAQETIVGDQNEIMRYDITNASSFPVTNTPVFACTLGLNGANFGGQTCSIDIGPNTNFIYAGFRRLNFSDANLQVFRSDTGARVYDSLSGAATDVFAQDSSGTEGLYGVKVSPDGRFLATLYADSQIAVVNLTNGIPDVSSIVTFINGATSVTARSLSWDAADNLYMQNGTAILRSWSLGISTTCVTSNDVSGTNGTFQLLLPAASATVVATANASQNYGSFALGAGNFHVDLGTASLPNSVKVTFKLTGTATNAVNYNIVGATDVHGVILATNAGNLVTLTFPPGTFGGAGNWSADIPITATASPTIGPSLVATLTLQGGTNYIAGSPGSASVTVLNTGSQFFFVSAAASGTTMSRAITNDYAKFVVNRWGDLNGPGNSAGSVTPKNITVTNFVLKGTTAGNPTDFTAGVQLFVNGQAPVDGTAASVSFAPGVSSLTLLVGNPVSHANALQPTTNVTIIPTLTNTVTGTNGTSSEGASYFVNTASTTLTEFDNAQGLAAEVVLWSDPLTNTAGAQYAVTYDGGNMPTNSLAVYIPNYQYTNGGAANGSGAALGAPSNYFDVQLGWPITGEHAWEVVNGVAGTPYQNPPPSGVMNANGWSNVLRMTVDKSPVAGANQNPTSCSVNFFPTTNRFVGNYALRFDMYLSIQSFALNNAAPGAFPRNFAAFGINTTGTNCNWRTGLPQGYVGFNNPTNCDGMWYGIDAADQSLTPADFDAFASPALPNPGTSDQFSGTASTESGVFKRPPFPTTDGAGAGTPINQWVNVSVETRSQTNVALIIDNTTVLPTLEFTNNATTPPNNVTATQQLNSGLWTNGTPMLGYMQPYPNQTDESAFVYYSNVRVVELSPYMTVHPFSAFILPGANVSFSSAATYASSANMTNVWMRGTTAPATVLVSDTPAGTNFNYQGFSYYGTNDAFTLTNVTSGSNYWSIWSDQAGSVTSAVACVEVFYNATNQTVASGGRATFTVGLSGLMPLSFQWKTNGVNLVNSSKYTNATANSLGISNCAAADAIPTYTCTVTSLATNLTGLYFVTNNTVMTAGPVTLFIGTAPSAAVVTPSTTNALWGSSVTFSATASGTAPFTYLWKKAGVNISGATLSSLTLAGVTSASAASYTVGVTNGGGGTVSSAGVLTVTTPAPTLGTTTTDGTTVHMAFTSPNPNDTTGAFTLVSSPVVTGPYTNTPGTFSGGPSTFQVTSPVTSSSNMFFRLLHVP